MSTAADEQRLTLTKVSLAMMLSVWLVMMTSPWCSTQRWPPSKLCTHDVALFHVYNSRTGLPYHTVSTPQVHHSIVQYTHQYNGPFPGLPRWAGTRKVKPIWILLKQETVSGSGINWAICKSAPCSRQTTTTGWMLPAAQPTASKHCNTRSTSVITMHSNTAGTEWLIELWFYVPLDTK